MTSRTRNKPEKPPEKPTDHQTEYEEGQGAVCFKVKTLAKWMRKSKRTLIYTGAGISTAAAIPDYRGPNGVWTLASQGKEVASCADLTAAEPTTSHMVIKELYRSGFVSHILSQNCDGLHLRSGIPQKGLSEIHGNMYIEVCPTCKPIKQYVRAYDVTEKSEFKQHKTGRFCSFCNTELEDTIVHFGEVGIHAFPLNWKGTIKLVEDADLIICLGTSLAVLKSYKFLWPKQDSDTKLVIVNLQWTPKDSGADIKIHAKSDTVLSRLAFELKLEGSNYCRSCDPILNPCVGRSNDIMNSLSDCKCAASSSSNGSMKCPPNIAVPPEAKAPGWWSSGINQLKRKAQEDKNECPTKKGPGRPRLPTPPLEESDDAVIRSVLLDLIDEIDPCMRKFKGKIIRIKKAYKTSLETMIEKDRRISKQTAGSSQIKDETDKPEEIKKSISTYVEDDESFSDSDSNHSGDPSYKPKSFTPPPVRRFPQRITKEESVSSEVSSMESTSSEKMEEESEDDGQCSSTEYSEMGNEADLESFKGDAESMEEAIFSPRPEKVEVSRCSSTERFDQSHFFDDTIMQHSQMSSFVYEQLQYPTPDSEETDMSVEPIKDSPDSPDDRMDTGADLVENKETSFAFSKLIGDTVRKQEPLEDQGQCGSSLAGHSQMQEC